VYKENGYVDNKRIKESQLTEDAKKRLKKIKISFKNYKKLDV